MAIVLRQNQFYCIGPCGGRQQMASFSNVLRRETLFKLVAVSGNASPLTEETGGGDSGDSFLGAPKCFQTHLARH